VNRRAKPVPSKSRTVRTLVVDDLKQVRGGNVETLDRSAQKNNADE
jgi:hypothetical protein